MICAAVILAAVYLGYYSKDVFVTPIVIAALLLPANRRSTLVLSASMAAYGLFFRQYWLILAGLFVVFLLVLRWFRPRALLVWGAAASSTVSLAIFVTLGVSADSFRNAVNLGRVHEVVGTRIDPFVDVVQPLGGVLNNVITYFALMIPFPVLLRGSLYYVAVAVAIGFIWIGFFRAVWPLSILEDPLLARYMALSIGLLSVQSLFEPDYGSALRHLTPILPLIACSIWRSGDANSTSRAAHQSRSSH